MSYATTRDGTRLYLKDWGSGRPVVMAHGWPLSAHAFATTDFRGDLAAFKVPTPVIHGMADKTVPIDASGRRAAKGIEHATLLQYDGAAHGLLASHKDRFIADVLALLRS